MILRSQPPRSASDDEQSRVAIVFFLDGERGLDDGV